jgi:hypothetical protein
MRERDKVIVLTEAELHRALSAPQALHNAYQSLHHAKTALAHVETIFWGGLRELGITSINYNEGTEGHVELVRLRSIVDKVYRHINDAQSIMNPIADAIERHGVSHGQSETRE